MFDPIIFSNLLTRSQFFMFNNSDLVVLVVASSSRRVRGRVVGHESEKRMRILGSRISVPLGAASGAFEGEYASTFAIELGSHIRRLVPLNKETWAAIDDGCKEAIFTAAAVIKQYFTS